MGKDDGTVLEEIATLGVKEPRDPTPEKVERILDAYIRTRELDDETMQAYNSLIDCPLETIIEGLNLFSKCPAPIESSR